MISLVVLRQELETSPDRDAVIKRMRDRVISKLETRTQRLWAHRADHEQVINVPSRAVKVYADLYPISDVSSVKTWDPSYQKEDDVDALETTSFDYDANRGEFWRIDGDEWLGRVKLLYSGGYKDDEAPADCFSAVIQQMKYEMVRNSPQRIANSSQASRGGGSSSFITKELHPEFEAFTKIHRRFAR